MYKLTVSSCKVEILTSISKVIIEQKNDLFSNFMSKLLQEH